MDLRVEHLEGNVILPNTEGEEKFARFIGKIIALDYDTEDEQVEVGTFQFTIFYQGDLCESMDSLDQDSRDYYERLSAHVKKEGERSLYGSVIAIDRLKVYEQHRGHALGLKAMVCVLRTAQGMGVQDAIAVASTYEAEVKESPQWLISYWEKAGLTHIGDGYLYFDFDHVLPADKDTP